MLERGRGEEQREGEGVLYLLRIATIQLIEGCDDMTCKRNTMRG